MMVTMSQPLIELRNVSKRFGEAFAVKNLSLSVEQGGFLVLLGASGCGKTTTLRLIAGLEAPDSGEIWLNGERVAGGGDWVPPEERRVGMVFQDYALFPHLTVRANLAFAIHKMPTAQREARIREMLALVGMERYIDRYPHQLSGGEQQRVALARALTPNPSVVLLDEPFSNLDAALRRAMRDEVRRILRRAGATAVFVTHDQEEAFSLADTVAVMRHAELLQSGPPQEVYLQPVTREVAAFLGDANFLPGRANGSEVQCALGALPLLRGANGAVEVMLRPESIRLVPDANGQAEVVSVRFFGHDQLVKVRLASGEVLEARTWPLPDIEPGAHVQMSIRGAVMAYPAGGSGS